MTIPKREANAILQSLNAGVTPRVGLQHIVVGRSAEITAFVQDLTNIREGGAALRFIVGSYGSGKSFFLQLARTQALASKFVVADADLTPERRLHGSDGQAIGLYRELMKNLSTQVRPDGNALPALIERWLSGLQAQVNTSQSLAPNTAEFNRAVEAQVIKTLQGMQELVHGFDFAQVINCYYRGYCTGNDVLKNDALRWLRGEIPTRTESKRLLGVNSIIDDGNWYDYLKAFARFAHMVGYAGLLVNIDEAVNLYKITHSISRNNNYEQLLKIINDCLQGGAAYLGFLFGGTPEFMDDQRRGLFSYEALRSRLVGSRFEQAGLRDLRSPVLRLPTLQPEEIYVLLVKLRDLHAAHVPQARPLDDAALQVFMQEELRRIGASQFSTPRELIRNFIQLSNLLAQNPDRQWTELLGVLAAPVSAPDPHSEILVANESLNGAVPQDTATTAGRIPAASTSEADPFARFSNFQM